MKSKHVQPLFSFEATMILKEILQYVRFQALNKQRQEEPVQKELRQITKIFEIEYKNKEVQSDLK